VLDGPLRHVMEFTHSHFDTSNEEDEAQGWRVAINSTGVQVTKDDNPEDSASPADDGLSRSGRLLNRAEAVAAGDLHITTDFDNGARTTQTLIGFGLILGGIGLCLISLVATRYTLMGLKRYVAMNVSLLRGR
jgi:hypothetical protein